MKLIITEKKHVQQPRPHYEDTDTEFLNVKSYRMQERFLTIVYENGEEEGLQVNEMKRFKLVKE